MPRRCVAGGCSNTNQGRFKLHKWPKRPEVARVWTAFVRKTSASWRKPTKWSHLCSSHFEERCYETTAIARSCGIQPRLRDDASPTVRPKKATVVAKTRHFKSPHKRVRLQTKHDELSGSAGELVFVSPLDLLASADVSLTQQEGNSKKLDPSFSTVFTSTPKLKKSLPGGRSAFGKRENTGVFQEICAATATPVTTAGDGLDEYSLRADAGAEIVIQVRPDVNSIGKEKKLRTDQPHSKEVSEMEAAHITPELPIRWVVSADRTVEIKEEVTELGCDQANERSLQEETPPSSITERGIGMKLVRLGRREESEMASSHFTVETPELKPALIKEESPALESVHIKQESPVPESVHIKEESPVLESVHIKEESPVPESVHIKRVILNSKPLSSLQGSLPCPGCGESFNPEGNLETSPGKTLHRCAGCVKTFRESGILNGQQQTGTGKTPYNCHECGADFRHHSTVKHHLRVLKVQLGYPCESEDSEMAPVHIKEELPELDPVHVKEELPELEPVHITEETLALEPVQINEESPEVESAERQHLSVEEREHDSTPLLQCKNSPSDKPQCKKHRETTPQEEKQLIVKIPSVQVLFFLESAETARSVCVTDSETQGNLKTLPCSTEDGKSSCQLGSPETHKGNHTGGTAFPCADCGKRFSNLAHLKRHQRVHTGEKPHHCNDCGRSFTQLGSFKTHQLIHTGQKTHHCNSCDKRFSRSEYLKAHQRIHTGEKPHHCNDCGKRFTQLGNLKKHQLIHTDEKPHHCNTCEKRFSRSEYLKHHQRIHTGEKPHHCNYCGRSFTQFGSLKTHQLIHTGEKPHHCNDCGKCFTQLGNLKIHQRIHTGEKPHHCNECGRSFTRIDNLKMHQRIHTGEKPHHCNDCGKSFTELGHLKRHQLIHAAAKP
ncbi:zinc finger protein 568-like isoform X2 [Acipenser ruthenus]|uniref:zinc finger protein 568-like isoform X2 n=1 Tax=Acipenser ruthenus TaxID=7906 RepID=UPI002740ACE4|nr:zinc finger protein 568-like isoform X2 [Acipenser ruthenus]